MLETEESKGEKEEEKKGGKEEWERKVGRKTRGREEKEESYI